MNIGIVGQGFVGSAIREGLKNFYTIKTYDIDEEKCNSTHQEVCYESDIIFVCIPTPMRKSGECDTRILESVVKKLNEECRDDPCGNRPILVIKSTIPPGTTKSLIDIAPLLHICFSPEFLTEANSFEDFKNQSRIIIGGPRPATGKVKQMFRKAFPTIPIVKTGTKTAEMVKYFTNCFLASKVTFANQIYQICLDHDIDYDKVCEYALYDERIGKSHLAVPGPDGDLGFGGHCFPKDLAAMISFGSINEGDTSFLKAVQDYNDKCRMIRDWEGMKGRAVSDD
jgi:nucleotide sugar dehydrogenase